MGLKENFKQAAQELMHVSDAAGAEDGKSITTEEKSASSEKAKPAKVAPAPVRAFFDPLSTQRQRTVIAKGDAVTGDLMCTGDLELYGTLTGNITGSGSLKLCGTLNGDAQGLTIEVNGGNVKGNLSAGGGAEVDGESVILGDIRAESLNLNGKVRGNLDIKDMLVMSEKAAVLGKISTGRLSVATGALFQGDISIPTMDFDSLF